MGEQFHIYANKMIDLVNLHIQRKNVDDEAFMLNLIRRHFGFLRFIHCLCLNNAAWSDVEFSSLRAICS